MDSKGRIYYSEPVNYTDSPPHYLRARGRRYTTMEDNSQAARIVATETAKRRTFAIISHPDAGKTTLTEKLLLYAGMLRTAGMVHGRKSAKYTSSDWMALEQERGISITASAMQFGYKGVVINVLDTPGHQDFSEDTYRTLTAADCAVMVIDSAKGVEAQTKKLFTVCRMHGVPILTFINKMDAPGKDPFDLVSEVEQTLGIQSVPMNWPIGRDREFAGIVDRRESRAILFHRSQQGGSKRAESEEVTLESLYANPALKESVKDQLRFELDLLNEAGNSFDLDQFLSGELTPVFFGSALTNFGVEPFFDAFSELAPAPRARTAYRSDGGQITVDPVAEPFSGYVFKIQANMNPNHRDSMAFIRICSGKFERDLVVRHSRLDKEVRLSRSHAMFGGERQTLDLGFPGDIIGVINPGVFAIGDSVSVRGGFSFKPMPKFPPEVVALIRPKDVLRKKSFDKGIQQLSDEGTVLVLRARDNRYSTPIIAAVGKLQFEVLQFRLQSEYNVDSSLDLLQYRHGAWLEGDASTFQLTSSSMLAQDESGSVVVLMTYDWEKNSLIERNPDHNLVDFLSGAGKTAA